jgi:hypothetical protein
MGARLRQVLRKQILLLLVWNSYEWRLGFPQPGMEHFRLQWSLWPSNSLWPLSWQKLVFRSHSGTRSWLQHIKSATPLVLNLEGTAQSYRGRWKITATVKHHPESSTDEAIDKEWVEKFICQIQWAPLPDRSTIPWFQWVLEVKELTFSSQSPIQHSFIDFTSITAKYLVFFISHILLWCDYEFLVFLLSPWDCSFLKVRKSAFCFVLCFETVSHYVAQSDFKLRILLPQSPQFWDDTWATMPGSRKSVLFNIPWLALWLSYDSRWSLRELNISMIWRSILRLVFSFINNQKVANNKVKL